MNAVWIHVSSALDLKQTLCSLIHSKSNCLSASMYVYCNCKCALSILQWIPCQTEQNGVEKPKTKTHQNWIWGSEKLAPQIHRNRSPNSWGSQFTLPAYDHNLHSIKVRILKKSLLCKLKLFYIQDCICMFEIWGWKLKWEEKANK